MKKNLVSLGFDLGTTYSSLAFAGTKFQSSVGIAPKASIATDKTGATLAKQFVPSAVCAYLENGELKWAIGAEAFERAETFGEDAHLYENYKLSIGGANFSENEYRKRDTNPELLKQLQHQTPESVAQHLIKHLFELAFSPNWGRLDPEIDEVESVTVTVPALWPDNYQRSVRGVFINALKRYDVSVVRTLEEPLAALHHQIRSAPHLLSGPAKKVLVIDYGGGTCDIALVEIKREAKEIVADYGEIGRVLGRSSMPRGGVLFDHRIAEELKLKLESSEFKRDRKWYWREAEKLKINFSNQLRDASSGGVALLRHRIQHSDINQEITMTVQKFSEIIRPELEQLEPTIRAALLDAGIRSLSDVRHIFLVGGTALLPLVREEVIRIFDKSTEITDSEPRLAVVYGAAKQAYREDFGYGFGIGVTAKEDVWLSGLFGGIRVVKKGQSLPIRYRKTIFWVKSGDEIEVMLYKGRRLFPSQEKRMRPRCYKLSKPARIGTKFVFKADIDSTGLMDFILTRPNHPKDTFDLNLSVPVEHDDQAMARRAGLEEAKEKWETL